MNIVVVLKLVPDLIEEIEIAGDGKNVDTTFMRLIINETDDHALEQAILLKEVVGATVTVLAPNVEDIDGVLFTAAAKGTDRQIKLMGDFDIKVNNHALARALATTIQELQPDLILTGVQAHNDLDGALGPILAEFLGYPYMGYLSDVTYEDQTCTVRKEYPGGLRSDAQVQLPAVLGIQAASSPPRYVAVSKVRQAMKTLTLDELACTDLDPSGAAEVSRMYKPEGGDRAEFIEGDIDTVAAKLVDLLRSVDAV